MLEVSRNKVEREEDWRKKLFMSRNSYNESVLQTARYTLLPTP